MAKRVCLVLCALAAVAVAAYPQQDDGIEDMNERNIGGHVVHLPVGALHVPAHGHGPVVQTPSNGPTFAAGGAINNGASIASGTLNPVSPVGPNGPAVVASGLTTMPTNTYPAHRPWNPFTWFKKPSGVQAAALADLTTPGKPGLCPYVRRLLPTGNAQSASICGNLCHNDWACPHKTKCCPTECGYSCFDAVFVAHNSH